MHTILLPRSYAPSKVKPSNRVVVATPVSQAVPYDRWPITIKVYAAMAQPGDRGVGDILERHLELVGAKDIAAAYERATGLKCGCKDRKETINRRYPLPKTVDLSAPQGV